MSRFGIRKRLKSGIANVIGKTDDTSSPNWQNRTASEVYRSAAAPPQEAPEAAPPPVAEAAPVEEASPVSEEAPAPPAAEVAEAVAEAVEEAVEAAPAPTEADAEEAAPAAASTMDPADDTAGPPISMDEVQEILDDMVRPALQGDGGDITLIKIEDNDIYVRLVGACSTCPSSIMTMKMGVEALLKEEFPAMRELIQVD